MASQFFIGGNKFYSSEEDANTELAEFEKEFGIPIDIFTVVQIDKEEPGDTFRPPPGAKVIH